MGLAGEGVMGLRVHLVASCDHAGCTRKSWASAVLELASGRVIDEKGNVGSYVPPGLQDVRIRETGWAERAGKIWCAEHDPQFAPKVP